MIDIIVYEKGFWTEMILCQPRIYFPVGGENYNKNNFKKF